MESEDKRVNKLTQISNAPVNGVLPIDVPGSTETNGITVDNLARTMPVATNDRNGLMPSTFFLNGSYEQIIVQYNTPIKIGRVRGFLMLQRPWDRIGISLFFIDYTGINVICDKDNLFRLLSVMDKEVYYTEPIIGYKWIKCWFQNIPFSPTGLKA